MKKSVLLLSYKINIYKIFKECTSLPLKENEFKVVMKSGGFFFAKNCLGGH